VTGGTLSAVSNRPDPMRPNSVPARSLSGLVSLLGLSEQGQPIRGMVTGVTHDSRRVAPGDLYAALPGSRFHGAVFAEQAAAAGAAGILTDREGRIRAELAGLPVLVVDDPRAVLGEVASWVYGRPARDLALLGVTGTSGKSTTTFLLEAGLRAAGHETGLIGGIEIRVAGEALPSALTTPEATDVHALFALMRERGVTAAAMEVSSHALDLGRVGGAFFEVALFTNLSQEHLDYHATMEDYFAVKARLFTPELSRLGVVNVDDSWGRRLTHIAKVPVTTFSADGDPGADWRAADVRLKPYGSTFRVIGPGGVEAEARVPLPGPFNVANALGAIVALVEAGISLPVAVRGIASLPGVPGRLEPVDEGQDFTVLVDYAHKPGAVEAVLGTLRPLTTGRLTIVLGCGGDRDRTKRPIMGEIAARRSDVAVFTNDNPRSEDPWAVLNAMVGGVLTVPEDERAHVIVEPDRAAAIALAVGRARRGDVVLVAGKGHEQGQYIAGEVLPFDDREVVRRALCERRSGTRGEATGTAAVAADDEEQP
jgi:UDP-N-acetylmuramoyl-L-alanyl-D-glutamate--2,6-diaminopimelate ligase